MVEPAHHTQYPPQCFYNKDLQTLMEVIEITKFSTIFVSLDLDVIFAPLFIQEKTKANLLNGTAKEIQLCGHLRFNNPLKALLSQGPLNCKIVFNCSDLYVTPSIYDKKKKSGEAVPTWDYIAAQLSGVMTLIESQTELREILDQQVKQFEEYVDSKWRLSDAPEKYVKQLMHNIFGIRFVAHDFKVHKKLHQNYPKNQIVNVVEWANAHQNKKRTVAHWIDQNLKKM